MYHLSLCKCNSAMTDIASGLPAAKRQRREYVEDNLSSEDDTPSYLLRTAESLPVNQALYIDTIDRKVLDFDFEKLCLVSLSDVNVYCCLVCGKYYQGRANSSHAYTHSVNTDHHVFVHLETRRFYVLPQNYEITSEEVLQSLKDIKSAISPEYESLEEIAQLSTISETLVAHDLDHRPYEVGFVGLNNISQNDYENVVLQTLFHVAPIRDFYLSLTLAEHEALNSVIERKSVLNAKLGALARKLWSRRLFRPHISPQDVLQTISTLSKKRFSVLEKTSPKLFMLWMLNHMHAGLAKLTKKSRSVVSQTFQGEVSVTTTKAPSDTNELTKSDDLVVTNTVIQNFWILTLSVPPNPLFKGDSGSSGVNDIPQVSIYQLLKKYDGQTTTQTSSTEIKRFQLKTLPPYLILHIDRDLESPGSRGNPTVVKFPTVIDFTPYAETNEETINYRLIANIRHELRGGVALDRNDDRHEWAVSLPKPDDSWVTLKDLEKTSCEKELMFLDESYIQVWEKI